MITAISLPAAIFASNAGEDGANLLFRWIHVVAGVIWIGHLYFFNFVNAELVKTYDADSKRKVVPELMPRALFWFRWGAAWTWITGFLMLALLYWKGPYFGQTGERMMGPAAVAFLLMLVGFAVYDQVAKALAKQAVAGLWVWFALVVLYAFALTEVAFFSAGNRAVFIHTGAMLGTAMAANVWMRIWPCQRRIITAIKAGQAPDPADAALAGLRSRHNTFMSVPLLLLMLGVHDIFGVTQPGPGSAWMFVLGLFVVAYAATDYLYKKSAQVKGF